MKKLILAINLLWFSFFTLSAQSMYGDQVKFDVKMKYVYSFEEALALAKEKNKLIFFNCFADWSVACHSMNNIAFSDQAFADWMDKNFINLFIDVTKGDGKALAERYNTKIMAQYLVLNSDGEVVHRIVGGRKISEFQPLVNRALSPKTSLKGMNEGYAAGNRKLPFLRDYFMVLRTAEENKVARTVLDEIFAQLKPNDWAKKENWDVFKAQAKHTEDEYFNYLIANKTQFVKGNGSVNVEEFISKKINGELFAYALGQKTFDAKQALNTYMIMQKSGLAKTDNAYVLYDFAKYRNSQDIAGLIKICEQQKDIWDQNVLRVTDLSIASLKNLSKEDKQLLSAYWQRRADSFQGSTKNHYLKAIVNLNTSTGIKFADLTLQEALDKAAKENKLVFLDCFTTWCGPCKWLDNNTFRDVALGEYFNKEFVSIKIDMEKGEGVELRKKLDVTAFPTMFVLSSNGEVVKKVIGALDVKALMEKVKI